MRGLSLDVFVNSPAYDGVTTPSWIAKLDKHEPDSSKLTKYVDVSAVFNVEAKEIRVAAVNRHETWDYTVQFKFSQPSELDGQKVRVYEVWGESLGLSNCFDGEKVKTVEKTVNWAGSYTLKKHSFQGKSFPALNLA